jgi:hypothetical protein
VAEWLRSGLQNRLHQFNSGRGLQHNSLKNQDIVLFSSGSLGELLPDLLPIRFLNALKGSLKGPVQVGRSIFLHARDDMTVEIQRNSHPAVT